MKLVFVGACAACIAHNPDTASLDRSSVWHASRIQRAVLGKVFHRVTHFALAALWVYATTLIFRALGRQVALVLVFVAQLRTLREQI